MRKLVIQTRYKIGGLLIVAIMIFVAVVPIVTHLSTQETMAALRSTLLKEQQYEHLLTLLRDAETGQRGFIITGRESFLVPYHQAIAEIPQLLVAMLKQSTGDPAEEKLIKEVFRIATLKLDELAGTVALRRSEGFAAVEPIVSSERGKQYMDVLRDLIGKEAERMHRERDALRSRMEHQSSQAIAAEIGASGFNFALLVLLMAGISRLLKSQQETTRLLQGSADELGKTVAEVELRNRQMETSAEMLQALDAVSSLEETSDIVSIYCGKLLPGMSGALFLYRNSRDCLEVQASWGKLSAQTEQLEQHDCWALRLGRSHYAGSAADLCCSHYRKEDDAAGCLCVPLVSQGEVTGLLYLEGLARGDEERQPQHVLIDRLAGQVALALSNAKLRESLRRQSIVDALTGLFNRRYLDETFKREFLRAARKAMPLSLIVLDLDHFKRVNDTFGHEAGDILLKQVAQQIRAEIRESDLACRFGGEEIVLLLPECELDAALDRAEKIRRAISLLEVQVNGRTLGTVTASFGVATFPKHGDTPEALLHAADLALYRAKHEGRNRVMAAA